MNLPKIKIAEISKVMDLGLSINRPVLLLGPAGVGKTSKPVAYAKSMGWKVTVVNLTDCGPQEATGYGQPRPDGTMGFSRPEWIPEIGADTSIPHIIILDEYPQWDQAVQGTMHSALYGAGSERRIGSHRIPDNVRFILTGNRKEDAKRGAKPLSVPLVNRCLTFLVSASAGEWALWAVEEGGYADTLVPSWVGNLPPINDGEEENPLFSPHLADWDGYTPVPTPRSLETACMLIQEHEGKVADSLLKSAIHAAIGESATSSLWAYRKIAKRVQDLLPKIVSNPDGLEIPEDRGLQFALATIAYNKTRVLSREDWATGVGSWFPRFLARLNLEVSKFYVDATIRRRDGFEHLPEVKELVSRYR